MEIVEARKVGEASDDQPSPHHVLSADVEDFLRGFAITITLLAVLTVLLLIPYFGIVIVLTVAPYIAGYKGGQHTSEWLWLSILSALIWSSVQLMVIIYLATAISLYGSANIGTNEVLIIICLYAANLLFCTIGAKVGAEAVKKKAMRKRRNRSGRN